MRSESQQREQAMLVETEDKISTFSSLADNIRQANMAHSCNGSIRSQSKEPKPTKSRNNQNTNMNVTLDGHEMETLNLETRAQTLNTV